MFHFSIVYKLADFKDFTFFINAETLFTLIPEEDFIDSDFRDFFLLF